MRVALFLLCLAAVHAMPARIARATVTEDLIPLQTNDNVTSSTINAFRRPPDYEQLIRSDYLSIEQESHSRENDVPQHDEHKRSIPDKVKLELGMNCSKPEQCYAHEMDSVICHNKDSNTKQKICQCKDGYVEVTEKNGTITSCSLSENPPMPTTVVPAAPTTAETSAKTDPTTVITSASENPSTNAAPITSTSSKNIDSEIRDANATTTTTAPSTTTTTSSTTTIPTTERTTRTPSTAKSTTTTPTTTTTTTTKPSTTTTPKKVAPEPTAAGRSSNVDGTGRPPPSGDEKPADEPKSEDKEDKEEKKTGMAGWLIGVIVGVVLAVLIAGVVAFIIIRRKRRAASAKKVPEEPKKIIHVFTPEELDARRKKRLAKEKLKKRAEAKKKPRPRPMKFHKINLDEFVQRGPLVISKHNYGDKHALDGVKSHSISGDVEFDTKLNELFLIGSDTEVHGESPPKSGAAVEKSTPKSGGSKAKDTSKKEAKSGEHSKGSKMKEGSSKGSKMKAGSSKDPPKKATPPPK